MSKKYSKNCWLDEKGEELLYEAKKKFISESKERPTDINVLRKALEVYVNGRK